MCRGSIGRIAPPELAWLEEMRPAEARRRSPSDGATERKKAVRDGVKRATTAKIIGIKARARIDTEPPCDAQKASMLPEDAASEEKSILMTTTEGSGSVR